MGVAGVVLERQGDSYSVRISDGTILYCKIFFCILNTLGYVVLAANMLATDLNSKKTPELSLLLIAIVWGIIIVTQTVLFTYGTFRLKCRMEEMISCLKDIQKVHKGINTKLEDLKNPFSDVIKKFVIWAYVLAYVSLILNIWANIYSKTVYTEYWRLIVQHLENKMIVLILAQISLVALDIETVVKTINNGLQELIQIRDLKRKYFKTLTTAYMSLCDIVKNFNDNNSTMIGMLMLVIPLYILMSGEYLLNLIVKDRGPVTLNIYIRIIGNLMWFICHLVSMFVLIEPCHRVHERMNETQILVTKLMYSVTSAGEPIPFELDIFYKQIELYKPTITARVFNLHRGQLSIIMVGVVTYLTIIVQHYSTHL
ncbi:PREDICTED: uncharacterized protein LOC106107911 [Papilio polytes]|uniref:uncharacterized protein LOC106107911 n=1 Tax=Papilio polytes TaxID=76194 RepID=UPI000676183B|nr:PREDICTED: uncharacterized protein LOC106107911 [Papilio polytes]